MKFCLFQITGTSPVNNYELIYPSAKTEVTFVLKETKNWKDIFFKNIIFIYA